MTRRRARRAARIVAAAALTLVTTATTVLSPTTASAAHADMTAATTGPSSLSLAGFWVSDLEPWIRMVFEGTSQAHMEFYNDEVGSWQRIREHYTTCGKGDPEYKDVTGIWPNYTGMAIHQCNGSHPDDSVVYTKAHFDIDVRDNSVKLTTTYGYLMDGWSPSYYNYFTRKADGPPPQPGDGPPPEDQTPDGVTCGEGESAFTMSLQQVFDLMQSVSWSGVFDQAQMATIANDPCVLSQLSFGEPTATMGTEYQYSEPVAGSAARVWRCAPFNVAWPIRGPFSATEPIGTVKTVTDACTDGKVLKGGDPTRADPPVASPPSVELDEPYRSLWGHSPVGGPTGRYTNEGTSWEYRQVMQYNFLHIAPDADDIVYTFVLGLPIVPDGPPFLHFVEPR